METDFTSKLVEENRPWITVQILSRIKRNQEDEISKQEAILTILTAGINMLTKKTKENNVH